MSKKALFENPWNDKYVPKHSVGCEYFYCMKKKANKTAQYLDELNESETYGQVLQRCIRTSLKLTSLGIKRGDVVCLNTYNHKNSIVPFIATQFLKATISALDPGLSLSESIHLLKLIKPKIIFVSDNAIQLTEEAVLGSGLKIPIVVFGETEKHIPFSEFLKPNEKEDSFQPTSEGTVEDIAQIVFSSGTTGLPKGVCLSNRTLIAQGIICTEIFQYYNDIEMSDYFLKKPVNDNKSDVFLIYSPFYWITASFLLTGSIFLGAPRVVCKQFNGSKWWSIISKYKVTSCFLAPPMVADLLSAEPPKKDDMSNLKYIIFGGCASSETMIKNLFSALPETRSFQVYGSTEIGGCIALFDKLNDNDWELQKKNPLSCGKAVSGMTIKIVDPESEEIQSIGETGEIRLKCANLMSGYLNQDCSSSFDKEGYLKTGDLGYLDKDGCLFIIDRIKEILKYKGWHISPAFVENVINQHEAVAECVVFGIPHDSDGEHPMALVVLNENNSNITSDDIKKFINERVVERHQLRAGIKIVDRIPKSITGKIKRKDIKDMVLKGEI